MVYCTMTRCTADKATCGFMVAGVLTNLALYENWDAPGRDVFQFALQFVGCLILAGWSILSEASANSGAGHDSDIVDS